MQGTSDTGKTSDLLSLALGALFLLTSLLSGVLLGGAFIALFAPKKSNGWDGIAQALGGLMVGGLLAVVVATVLLFPLLRRGRKALLWATLAAVGLSLLTILSLRLLRPPKMETAAVTRSTQASAKPYGSLLSPPPELGSRSAGGDRSPTQKRQ